MPDPVTLASVASIKPLTVAPVEQADAGSGAFGAMFSEALARVNAYQEKGGAAVARFLSGEDEEVHKVAIMAQQADLSFDLFLQVKNKVVQAYQEVMRMQL
jgi:flagellar hook-basal body complex protein FliE